MKPWTGTYIFPSDDYRDEKDDKEEEEAVSFRNRIKAFEKTHTPEPSPVSKGPTPKKRPQSEAFKAFENKGIIIGMVSATTDLCGTNY